LIDGILRRRLGADADVAEEAPREKVRCKFLNKSTVHRKHTEFQAKRRTFCGAEFSDS
jgi:hypothetical protein